jgi:hypothetical protein
MLLWSLTAAMANAQVPALDSVWVERYQRTVVNGDTLHTFRIYATIAPDHRLQMVYGAERHALHIVSSAPFHNVTEAGSYAHEVGSAEGFDENSIPDSWITIGAVDKAHWGIPVHLDTKGSIYGGHDRCRGPRSARPGWCSRDGAIPADSVPQVVTFRFTPSYLATVKGSELHTLDGAWAVLGGVSGMRTQGHVLLAQLTTKGDLGFRLNLQFGLPDGSLQRYVHADPEAGELVHPSLRQVVSW